MNIIEISALQNGAHRNQSGASKIPTGWAMLPNYLETPNFPFGDVTVEDIGGVKTVTAWNAGTKPPIRVLTNAEKRKMAYETGIVDGIKFYVIWNNLSYTTDSLTQLGVQYQFRGETEISDAIEQVVKTGIAEIRAAFPDEIDGGFEDADS